MDNVMGREFHAVADLFPLMRGAAFDELVADIRAHGLREPILLDAEGRILDGRNRYRACLEAGVEPHFNTWQGDEPLPDLALSLNLRRRHLDESQRAMVAARLARMLQASRPARGANLHHGKLLRSHDLAAAAVNVSRRLLMHASRVLHEGSDDLIAAVDSGQIAVSKASLLVRRGGAREIARKARERRRGKTKPGASWPFGAVPACPAGEQVSGEYSILLLWVHADGFDRAVEVLKARGFRYDPSGAPRE